MATQLLVKYKVSVDAQDQQGHTPLITAASNASHELIVLLQLHGAHLAVPCRQEADILALDRNRTGVLGAGLRPLADVTGRNALHHACASGVETAVLELIKWPKEEVQACLNSADLTGQTPVGVSMQHGYHGQVIALIRAGASPFYKVGTHMLN